MTELSGNACLVRLVEDEEREAKERKAAAGSAQAKGGNEAGHAATALK